MEAEISNELKKADLGQKVKSTAKVYEHLRVLRMLNLVLFIFNEETMTETVIYLNKGE